MLNTAELARLAADPRWQGSRFENLERFIYDFLVGKTAAAASGAWAGCSLRCCRGSALQYALHG